MKKRVLFCIDTLRDGGAEKVLVNIVNNLNPQKYDIEVRLIYKKGVYLEKLNPNVKLTYIVDYSSRFVRILSHLLQILPSEILHLLFIKRHYDVEIAFLEGYATKIIAGAPKKTRKIAWVHCDLVDNNWIKGVYSSERGFVKCYSKYDKIISVAQSVEDAFIRRFGKVTSMEVKYNPIDSEIIKREAEESIDLLPSKDRLTLISIGRLTAQKNFHRLFATINRLIIEGYKVELWLLGEGEERASLEAYISSNYLLDYIKMLGYKSNPYPYIKSADLFVCSSNTEGYSTAVTEAIILDKPVVTTEVAGMREMLGNSEYGLITMNSDEAFFQGIKSVLDDEGLLSEYNQKAQERSSYFEFANRLHEIENLFGAESL